MARNGRNRRNSGVWVTFCTVFKPCIFIGFRRFAEPQDYSLRNHEKPPGKLHHRQKSFTRLRNRRFFVETLRRRATFRVSGGKWQRFSFFLGATKTKKQLLTKNFAYAQYDALKYRHSEPVGRTLRVSSYVRLTPASEARISPATVVVGAKPKAPCRKSLSLRQGGRTARPISFWLRFFLFGRNKKNPLNPCTLYGRIKT